MTRGAGRRAWWAGTVWTAALFVGFSTPGVVLPDVPVLSPDKLVHVGAFAVWAWLWARAVPGRPWTVAAWGAAFGVWVEIWQTVAPLGRMGSWADAAADAVGIALGLAAHARAQRRYASNVPSSSPAG